MACLICDNALEKNLLYENDKIKVMLAIEPSTNGHLQIFSKQHYAILEEVPEALLSYMSVAANKLSMLLFELLKVHGTNIIIQNGVPAGQNIPHFSMHIIPRRTDDGLKLDWDMKQAAPEALENIHRIISEGMNAESAQRSQGQETKTELVSDTEIATGKTNNTGTVSEEAGDETSPEDAEGEELIADQDKEMPREKKINYYVKSLERIP